MTAEDQSVASAESGSCAGDEHCLHLELHTDEAVWMRQIGHLKDWCSQTRVVKLGVPALVTTPLAANSIRLLWLFPNLQQLDISFNSTRSCIEQSVLTACAELLHLTSLSLSGGHLPRRACDLDLGVLTSLRRLACLTVRTHGSEGLDGLEDEQLLGVGRLTGLRSLSLRASENVTDEGLTALGGLTALTQLQLVPLGLCVTRSGVACLAARLPLLAHLAVGLHEARQVAALKGLEDTPPATATPLPPVSTVPAVTTSSSCATVTAVAVPAPSAPSTASAPPCAAALSVVLNSPEASASAFLSTLTLVLRGRLRALRLATVEATDPAFLLALGTLTGLTELKMGVSLPEGGRPFSCALPHLAPLSRLRTLEFAVTRDLGLPLTVKMVSLLALSWPQLRSLSLSCMTKPEVAPEALDLLDNFSQLQSLSLFAPLDYDDDDDDDDEGGAATAPTRGRGDGNGGDGGRGMGPLLLPITPRYLPPGLTHLVLECAQLRHPAPAHPHAATASSACTPTLPAAGTPPPPLQQLQSPSFLPAAAAGCEAATPPRGSCAAQAAAPSAAWERTPAAVATPCGAAGTPRCSGGGGGGGGSGGALLPRLQNLELTSCCCGGSEVVGDMLRSATGLRHLELSEVRGLSDACLQPLSGLTRLEHLAVRLGQDAAGPAPAAAATPPRAPARASTPSAQHPAHAAAVDAGCVTHRSLALLRNCTTLRHLEWSLPQPLGARELLASGPAGDAGGGAGGGGSPSRAAAPAAAGGEESLHSRAAASAPSTPCAAAGAAGPPSSPLCPPLASSSSSVMGVLMTLSGLQELSLHVVPELRSGGSIGVLAAASGMGGGAGERSGGEAGGAAGGWRERLQRALPLCVIAERPGMVLYDLWNDRTVNVMGP